MAAWSGAKVISVMLVVACAGASAVCMAFVAPDRSGDRVVERRNQTFEALFSGTAEMLPTLLAAVFLVLTGVSAFVAHRVWRAGPAPE